MPTLFPSPARLVRAGMLIIALLACTLANAQEAKRGYWWPLRQNTSLLFINEQPTVRIGQLPLPINAVCTGFADLNGSPQAATNGVWVTNGLGHRLKYVQIQPATGGYYHNQQSTVLLPLPETTDSAMLMYWDNLGRLHHAVFTMNGNPNDSTPVPIVSNLTDSVTYKLIPIRHGNGKDWWVLTRAANTNTWLRYLVTRQGVQGPWHQAGQYNGSHFWDDDGKAFYSDSWQRIFTPNLAYYTQDTTNIRSWGFDRWTGLLCCEDSIPLPIRHGEGNLIGTALSPSGSYLYYTSWEYAALGYSRLSRIDLRASGHPITTIDTHFNGGVPGGELNYTLLCLGPDGKLYMGYATDPSSADTLSRYLGVIEAPDDTVNCRFKAKGLFIGQQNIEAISMPSMPDYTLGVSTTPAGVAKGQAAVQSALRVYPNPSQGGANVLYELPNGQTATLRLTDLAGRQLWQAQVAASGTLALPQGLAAGAYTLSLQSESGTTTTRYIVLP